MKRWRQAHEKESDGDNNSDSPRKTTQHWRMVARQGQSKVSVTQQGVPTEITAVEAAMQKLFQLGMSGSSQSMRQYLEAQQIASERLQNEIDQDCADWTEIRATRRKSFAAFKAKHGQDPDVFPHPDDIKIDRVKGVRFESRG